MINKMSHDTDFTTKGILYMFCKYAIPSAVCMLFVGIQTIIDGFFVGNYAGADALAGLNITIPIYTLTTSIVVVVGVGCQSIIGISSGAGNLQTASDALQTALRFLLFFTVIISVLILLFCGDIISFLGADTVLYDYSKTYILALSPFFAPLSLLFLGDYYLKSQGRPYTGLFLLGSSVVLNIILDYLFIVKFGMGVLGAALATGGAFCFGAITVLPMMSKRRAIINICVGSFRPRLLKQMLLNGSSEGISEVASAVTIFLFNRILMSYAGASGVAAFTAINYMLFIGITLFVGLSDGIIPVMSYNFGALQIKRVLRLYRLNIFVNLFIGLMFFLFLFFFGENIITLFFEGDLHNESILKMATTGAKICAFAFFFNGFNIASSSFFTALGDAKSSAAIASMRGLIFIFLGICVLPPLLDVHGMWLTIPFAELMTLALTTVLVKYRTSLKYFTNRINIYKNN